MKCPFEHYCRGMKCLYSLRGESFCISNLYMEDCLGPPSICKYRTGYYQNPKRDKLFKGVESLPEIV